MIKKISRRGNSIQQLYLIYKSVEYETYNYTIRTHYLLKNTNDEKYKLFGVTRYGYPYDREAGYYQNVPEESFDLDNVTYIKLLNKNDNFNVNNILNYIKKYIMAVIKLALETNAKIIHASSNYWNGMAAYYAAKYLKIKCVYELRSLWDEGITIYKPEIKNSDMIKMMINQEKKILQDVDKIITINKTLKKMLVNDGFEDKKIEIIHNGVDTTLFSPSSESTNDIRFEHSIAEDDIVIGYIGTIAMYEGLDYILKCIKTLNNKKLKFLIIGDGFYKNELISLIETYGIQKNVIYLGKINHRNIIKYYNIIDIVVYPRKRYDMCVSTSSYKILESMSMEKPIIVSDLEAYNEIIIDGENGLYCKPDNLDDLLQKIKMLIDDENLRTRLGKNAREWVMQNREWSDISNGVKQIYDELLQ